MIHASLIFGGTLIFVAIFYLAVSKKQRYQLLHCLKGTSRKPSSTSTPPPSLPEKQPAKQPAYDSFPPLRRHALLEIAKKSESRKTNTPSGIDHDIDEQYIKRALLPMTTNYEPSPGNLFTPTGFSVKEIKSLGDFPDYETLSDIPLPDAYPQFDIDKALPRPYRPFRWSYHQTMSLTKLDTNWWIELENTYRSRIQQRKELYEDFGKLVLDYLPGTELACKETMEMVLEYVCARYPHYFSLSSDKRYFKNGILGITEDLKGEKHPLRLLMDNIPEDFAITMRDDKTGIYVLRAGVICSSLGWNLASKMDMQLHEIHGIIPDYKEKMQFSMDKYFSKMPTEKPIQRGSWGFEVEKPLFMAPSDPHESYRLSQDSSLSLSDCHLRVDWQTLRRLPLSGAIVFNFKAVFTPVTEFRDEPGVPALIYKVLTEGQRAIMEYKNTWHTEHVVLPASKRWAEEQVENGLVERDWQVSTLDDSPHYKGWEEKWRHQQGF